MRLITVLVLIAAVLGITNIWQYRTQQASELARLQATLVRPAQFDGTAIQDPDLKEASFGKQSESPLAVTTQEAQDLLSGSGAGASSLFFDVRETGEHRMGTLPGAQHVRFPDFMQSNMPLEGKRVVLFCHNGNRSSEICGELAARGIDCRFIAGGIEKWIVEGRKFSDEDVQSLSDLRAIPQFPNKETLLGTAEFTGLMEGGDLQIVDTRYPGDFSTGHLPGAINIPIRALPTDELNKRIALLQDKPTVAACYDRRSCFMSQVLALEMHEVGIDFRGRYTTPWEYFVPPAPKLHVQQWQAEQQITLWQTAVAKLADVLVWLGERSHFVLAMLALSLLSRLLVLPIALKSERDQMITAKHGEELKTLKETLKDDPTRKARAIQQFYADKGMTPMRNLAALLFLPVMMLGLSATEKAGTEISAPFLWVPSMGQPDGTFVLPLLFAFLAGTYLHWAVAKSRRQAVLWWAIGAPLMFGLVFQLSAAGNIYLCISLTLLLVQRAYVTGLLGDLGRAAKGGWQRLKSRKYPTGIFPLKQTVALRESGNKSYRLSMLKNAGLPVPDGLVIRSEGIKAYGRFSDELKDDFASVIWHIVGQKPCAVRSSAAAEDGADQSFAGVFDSVLDVQREGMRDALDDVIASFSSVRAQSYDCAGEISHDGNILVQQMVRSEYAGVLFTQDPTAPGLMVVELVLGCGDDLVSGRVTPQTLQFGRHTGTAFSDDTPPIDLAPLLALGQRIEAIFGCPQDIEWAYADGAFQIVQSRDITTLKSGNPAEMAWVEEWERVLQTYKDTNPDAVIIEQDEMSEVLPLPTPLSFSLMGRLWAPGGSVDIACRQLGVSYNLPEGRPGHLVNLFGRTFVDSALKQKMALRLGKAKARQLRKNAVSVITEFREQTIPALERELAVWRVMDFSAMPPEIIISCIEKLEEKFVREIYVEAEKINILAGFTMNEAEVFAKGNADAYSHLMHPVLHHTPASLIEACAGLEGDARKSTLLTLMGHRAIFDYELSTPRYCEAPDLLWPLLEGAGPVSEKVVHTSSAEPQNPVDLAIAFQDLKEQAKHEALKLVAEMRRAILALGEKTGLYDLVFHLDLSELLSASETDLEALKSIAQGKKERADHLSKRPLKPVSLTLRDCERLSASVSVRGSMTGSALGGVCVSGSQNVSGRVFVVQDDNPMSQIAFSGFEDGDIIVCRMVSPVWLPFVQRSGGVLSEVGGSLSHMAIVAREKDILMHVKCTGLDGLQIGMTVAAGTDGSIVVTNASTAIARKIA
ncbi:PEP/pyruvate-binding domain-containing protein [Sulfitobacter sp.]|uniref:PEP/pyruvate-binding domain-containing protein n=1 Tax=Sulfitobacter sp. TaxID=1903071 RepID=UPI0030024D56